MMDCHRIQSMLSERRGGVLPAKVRARIAEHLQNCAACREVEAALDLAVAAARSIPAARLSDNFLPNLRAALPARRLPGWRVWLRPAYGLQVAHAKQRLAVVGMLAALLLSGTTGLLQKQQAERRAEAYLALCAQRHELYASRFHDETFDGPDSLNEKAAIW